MAKTWGERAWRVRVKAARARGGTFTPQDVADAGEYGTCKVAEEIERTGRTLTIDMFAGSTGHLFEEDALGMQFYRAVKRDDVDEAERLCGVIERRASVLAAERRDG